ncbi:hypothetical protein G6011_08672 [Alternaria panax]|uniref:Uncharacterized protein n=1 Tax=Alternaria panax TaxID=48097 RepID=A0AAD4FHB8_9PLEO|nr:hypothetical protein G6011_08672 [Alternaria panax]
MSDISELTGVSDLTNLSRTPSPVPGYDNYASPRKFWAASSTEQNMYPNSAPSSGEEGGFGTLDALPVELRQEIYGLAFGVDVPVTVKECCNPDMSKRNRANCPKHSKLAKPDAGRFNILQVSKALREEAMWVIFGKGSLLLNTEGYMSKYFCGRWSKSLRGMNTFKATNTHQKSIWNTANQFRMINVEISEGQLQNGNPYIFIDRLVRTVSLLCTEQDQNQTAPKSVDVDLGSLFHRMLPFNEHSQIDDRYGDYLDWLCAHSDIHDPDHDKLAKGVKNNLQRLASIIGRYSGHDQWRVLVKTEVPDKDKGGAKALKDFCSGCEEHGVKLGPYEN